MSAPDISAMQASVLAHVQSALGASNWNIIDGAPRGYSAPQVNVWWTGIPVLTAPMELQEIQYRWTIRVIAESESDPDRQDNVAVAWQQIFDEWSEYDAIALGGNCQLAWPSSVESIEVEVNGHLYTGLDITLTAIVKTARVFT